jgi:hypothetical protein
MSRVKAPRSAVNVREHVARSHERAVLRAALVVGDDVQVGRSRRWVARVRGGEMVDVPWFALPAGAFPRGGRDPSEYVTLHADGRITWAGEG